VQYGEGRSGLLVLLQERDLELQKMSISLREYRESAEDIGAESRRERSRSQALQREVAALQEELSRSRQKRGKSQEETDALERQVD
jgi:chromosome segregation ATPase